MSAQSWAAKSQVLEDSSSAALMSMVMFTITLVQGAGNGLFMLCLRRWHHEFAGDRWNAAFWFGFPIAFIITILCMFTINLFGDLSLGEMGLSFGIISIIANLYLSWKVAGWAARE